MPDFSTMPEVFVSDASLAGAVSREVKRGPKPVATGSCPLAQRADLGTPAGERLETIAECGGYGVN
jgi:hypothetical protein